MPKSTQVALGVILVVCVALVASASNAEAPHRVFAKTVESGCKPFPAPCGTEVDWSAGVGYAVALEAAELEAFLASIAPKASSGGGSSGCARKEPLYSEGDRLSGPIPSHIINRESGGDYHAVNCSSTASGKYQVLDSTWAGFGGYARAVDAPPEIQNEWARQAREAAGCRPWGESC
jgi:hypothetical protein